MNRLARLRYFSPSLPVRRGYTLIEILVATMLSLMILGAVVHLFGTVGTSINQSRSILESAERLRTAQNLLQMDLEGLTVTPIPPRKLDNSEGYLEIIKGPVVQTQTGPYVPDAKVTGLPAIQPSITTDGSNRFDTSVGALGNILMFTTRTKGKPFVGRYLAPRDPSGVADHRNASDIMLESDVAEVAYYLRGGNLHRRVLLVVAPALPIISQPDKTKDWVQNGALGFYADNDISVRWVDDGTSDGKVIANTLSDLTRRECRFAHPLSSYNKVNDARLWYFLGLPTLQECSDLTLDAGRWDANFFTNIVNKSLNNHWNTLWAKHPEIQSLPNKYVVDFWSSEPILNFTESELTANGTRTSDDLILSNVISFDVKVWDAGYPILQDSTGQVLKPGDANYILPGDANYSASLKYNVLGFGGYVDLGYYPSYLPYNPGNNQSLWKHNLPCPAPQPNFNTFGYDKSLLSASNAAVPRVYDTWCNTYDFAKTKVDPSQYYQIRNGFDDPTIDYPQGAGIVDNDYKLIYNSSILGQDFVTPYPAPLRGIQVIIRIFEPDSRQIREVTIEQDFLPK